MKMPRTAHDLAWPDLVWSHFSRPRYGGFDERVAAAAAAGFAGIGLYALEYRRLRCEEGRSAADIRSLVADSGLVVSEIDTVRGWSTGDGGPTLECRELEEIVYEMADELGCRRVQAIGPYAGSVQEAATGLAALSDRAAAHGLLVGIEFLPHTNIRTADEARALVEAANRPNAGYCVDIWHHKRGADDDSQLRSLPPERVFAVQMSDGTRAPVLDDYIQECMTHRMPPGQGNFDCEGFVRLLDGMGVRAPISVEICSTDMWAAPAVESAHRAADGMRAVLAAAGVDR
jgi:sugar phosphate isomerase/epimerase